MTQRYRAAIIGCGRIGCTYTDEFRFPGVHSHAQAYRQNERIELVGLCDRDPQQAARCGERWNVDACYHNLETMLAEQQPDIISVCTPDETHTDVAERILTSSNCKALFMEKPLGLNLEEAERLVSAARDRNALLAVNYTRRFADGFQRLKQELEEGLIGRIHSVHGYYTKGVIHNGTHWFDLARFLVGDVERVSGRDRLGETGPDPTLDVCLTFSSGAAGTLIGCNLHDYTIWEMDLLGTAGRVRIVDSGRQIEIHKPVSGSQVAGYTFLELSEQRASGQEFALAGAVDQIVNHLDEGSLVSCSGQDATAALGIALAAVESVARPNRLEACA